MLNEIRHTVVTLEQQFSVTALDHSKNWPLKTIHKNTKFSVVLVVSRKTFSVNVTQCTRRSFLKYEGKRSKDTRE